MEKGDVVAFISTSFFTPMINIFIFRCDKPWVLLFSRPTDRPGIILPTVLPVQQKIKLPSSNTQLTFTCSKSTIETLEKGEKYIKN